MTEYWKKQMEHGPTKDYYATLVWFLKERNVRMNRVLELGTGWGISGAAFLDAGCNTLVTIDCNQEAPYGKLAVAELHDHRKDGQTVVLHNERMAVACEFLKARGERFDLVYVDGAHDYENALADLWRAKELVAEGGLIIMDDYLHIKNIDGGKNDDWYGIARAVREFMLKTGCLAGIVPTRVNGFLVIYPEEKNGAL